MKGLSAFLSTYSTPELFANWMRKLLEHEMQQPRGQRMVCVTAWNKWPEGAYLEPDAYFGFAYLNALYDAFMEIGSGALTSPAALAPVLSAHNGRDADRP